MDPEVEESSWFLPMVVLAAVLFIVLFLVRKFFKGGQFTERVSAKGLVVVVTGANCGIGYETVKELNLKKADVYMLCRNEDKANEAKRRMVRQGCDATRLHFIECDLTDFESVCRAAKELLESVDTIDILINNAGIMFQSKHELTKDGHEKTWQSNHLGPFLLTELLLPAIKKSSYARIVNVSSLMHTRSGKINIATVDDKKSFGMMKSYSQSKLANVMHARALTKELRKDGAEHVSANSVHPGGVDTELTRNTILVLPGIKQISAPFRWFFLKTSRDGAQTSLYVALSKKLGGISGKYFADCKLAKENPLALDDQACQDLYNYSLEVTGLAK
uniref:Retinol dehydrogenase 12 n=1 Tax=Caenorhabditis tropicalis TaxID=1561998 RepID=A0A1I7UVW9_9PELO